MVGLWRLGFFFALCCRRLRRPENDEELLGEDSSGTDLDSMGIVDDGEATGEALGHAERAAADRQQAEDAAMAAVHQRTAAAIL